MVAAAPVGCGTTDPRPLHVVRQGDGGPALGQFGIRDRPGISSSPAETLVRPSTEGDGFAAGVERRRSASARAPGATRRRDTPSKPSMISQSLPFLDTTIAVSRRIARGI